MFQEVPVLPVVVPLAALVLAVLVWHLHRRGLLTPARVAVAVALCVYVSGIVANTVFPIFLDKPDSGVAWDAYLDLGLLGDYEVTDAIMNICVFVPVGVLVPLVLPAASWLRVLAVATAFSLAIEVSQLLTANLLGGGHVADANDLLFNVAGAALGYALLRVGERVPAAARVVSRFRWA